MPLSVLIPLPCLSRYDERVFGSGSSVLCAPAGGKEQHSCLTPFAVAGRANEDPTVKGKAMRTVRYANTGSRCGTLDLRETYPTITSVPDGPQDPYCPNCGVPFMLELVPAVMKQQCLFPDGRPRFVLP